MPVRPLAALVAAAVLLGGCASRSTTVKAVRIASSGTVRDDIVTVRAPHVQPPALDPTIGLPRTRTPAAIGSGVRGTSATQPTLSGMLGSVEVSAGTSVRAGQVLGKLDDRALALGVEIARAAAARSHAGADVLDARLTDLERKADDLAATRATVLDAIAKAKSGRATLLANIAGLERLAAAMPAAGGATPGATPPSGAPRPSGPDPRVLLARLRAQLAKVDAGLAQAKVALAKLDSAAATLADARAAIRSGRTVLREAAEAADAAVPVAEAKRAQAVLVAPYDGVVTWIAEPGTGLMANAPVARMRRRGPAVIDTYLTAQEVSVVLMGDRAEVSTDWLGSRKLPGHVTDVRPVSEYPPTALPSQEIHLLRAFRVTVTLDDPSVAMPPGTPADLEIPIPIGGRVPR